MHADSFDVLDVAVTAEAIFTPRAKLMFAVDLFWANFKRYLELEAAMIQTDEQMLVAQQCVSNLRTILLKARKVHTPEDYTRMAEPILLEIQQREQEILVGISG